MSDQPMSFEQAQAAVDAHIRHGRPAPTDIPAGEPTSLSAVLLAIPRLLLSAARWPSHVMRWARCSVLRLKIWDTKRYLAECEADDLRDSLALREFRQQLDDMQADLQTLQGRS